MLVGVGPGDPGLATMHAVEAIKRADTIRNCEGCATNLLHLASPDADVRPFESADEVVQLARSGRRVAVLSRATLTHSPAAARSQAGSTAPASTSSRCPG
jgi:siroheme synthase